MNFYNFSHAKKVEIRIILLFILLFFSSVKGFSQCEVAGCTPTFKGTFKLPAEVFSNCDSIRAVLESKTPNKTDQYVFTWTLPDGSELYTKNIKPAGPGTYSFCFDTAASHLKGICPKSITIVVTDEVRPKFADAGPEEINVCFNTPNQIGLPGDYNKYKYTWLDHPDKNIQKHLIGNGDTLSNPIIIVTSASAKTGNRYWETVYFTATDKITGCKDHDKLNVYVNLPPAIKIENIAPSYCVGETPQIDLMTYYRTESYEKFTLTISNEEIKLSNPSDTLVVYGKYYSDPFAQISPYPSKKFQPTLPPGTHGRHQIKFTVTTIEGCNSTLDTSVFYNGGISNVVIEGLDMKEFCGDFDDEIPIKATKSGEDVFAGPISITPPSPALTGDHANGYFFNPSKAAPGKYAIVYREEKQGDNCGSTGIDTVRIKSFPVPKLIGRNSVCTGALEAEYLDTASLGPDVIKTWQVSANGTWKQNLRDGNDSIVVDWAGTGTGTVTVTNDDGGCFATDFITVTFNNTLNSSSPVGDSVQCISTDPVRYTTNKGQGYYHKWFAIGGTISPEYSGYREEDEVLVIWQPNQPEYKLYLLDSSAVTAGCMGTSDTLTINFGDQAFADILTADTIGCSGSPLVLRANPAGGTDFTWSPGNLSGSEVTLNAPFASQYILTVTKGPESKCDPQTDTVKVLSSPSPARLLPDAKYFVCLEEADRGARTIKVTKGDPSFRVEWNNDPEFTAEEFYIDSIGTYFVKHIDTLNCFTVDTFSVIETCVPRIFVPTAFSPNNDKSNDFLEIFGNKLENFRMTIYNRWGEVVFLSSDKNTSWDGTFNGDLVAPGLYPWVITVDQVISDTERKRIVKEGSVSVVR